MKLWGWVQDNVSDSDMKARIPVHIKMQTFSFFYGLQLVILSNSDNLSSSLQRVEPMWSACSKESQALSLFFDYMIRQGCKPPLDQGQLSCYEVGVTSTFTSMSLQDAMQVFEGNAQPEHHSHVEDFYRQI